MCVAAFLMWLYVIPKTSLGRKLYLSTSQDGKAPSENMKPLIGRTATALTILVPTGKVEIDGLSYDARCITSHVEAGERVTVEDANAFELKVKKI